MNVYFDNAATTKTSESVLQAMLPYFTECYGNASSIYSIGTKSKEAITKSRETIAATLGAKPEEARSILPNSLKTEIVVSMNLRSWRHFFELRTSGRAHPQIREIAVPLLRELADKMPVFFKDIADKLPENS